MCVQCSSCGNKTWLFTPIEEKQEKWHKHLAKLWQVFDELKKFEKIVTMENENEDNLFLGFDFSTQQVRKDVFVVIQLTEFLWNDSIDRLFWITVKAA